MQNVEIEYRDDGPDNWGRRHFFLNWTDPDGEWRTEPHPKDGEPVGFRRGQRFFTDPEKSIGKHLPSNP